MKKYLKFILPLLLLTCLFNFVAFQNTYARPSTNALAEKVYINGMGKCSNNSFFTPSFSLYELTGFNALTTNSSTVTINLPNGLTNATESSTNCKNLFSLHIPETSKVPSSPNNRQAAKEALESIGYIGNPDSASESKRCGEISYRNSSNAVQSTSICFSIDGGDNLDAGEIGTRSDMPNTSEKVSLYYGNCNGTAKSVCMRYYDVNENRYDVYDTGRTTPYTTWAEVEADLTAAAKYLETLPGNASEGYSHQYSSVQYSILPPEGSDNIPTEYNYGTDVAENANKLVNYFGGYDNWGAAAFTDQDKYWFYVDILDNFYGVTYDNSTCQVAKFDGAIIMKNQDGNLRWCKVSPANKNIGAQVNIFPAGNYHYLDETTDINGVISALGNLDFFSKVTEYKTINEQTGEVDDPTIDPDPSNGEADDTSDICYGSRGTLGMSWLLCPVMSWMANSLNWFYDSVVEDYVQADTNVTFNDDVYRAWGVFQNAANIVVVLILLVVIFSQLTGVGIDNYGIKKILPRLIIFAILINLSYFIMQLLVDASNIIGNSVGGLFQVTGTGQSTEAIASSVDIPSNILGITVATSAGVGIAAVIANPAILLALLLVLISGLISVLLMWVILITRQALILIAIIIAPIAIASYVLPNTRTFGKRWGSLVKDLLILYPEAAFLIGVCFFASDLMAKANEAMTFPAIIFRVLPFIALPELFRRSINAIDGLGNRLSSFGNNISRSATGAMRSADWYKNAQERGMERRTRIRAGLDREGNEATGWRGMLRSRNNRNRARYRQQYLKTQAEENKASLLNDPNYMDEMRFKQQLELEGEQNEIRLMQDPNYRSVLQAKQASDLEKKQSEAQASALKAGKFTYSDSTGTHTITDPNDSDALKNAYIAEASKDARNQDAGKLKALYDAIRAKGDSGIDTLGEIWDSGKLNTNGRGFMDLRDNIVGDSEIKGKARTLHTIAKEVQSGKMSYSGGQVASARAAGAYVADIAPEKVPDLSAAEMNALNDRAQSGDASAQRVIHDAWSDERIRNRMKGGDKDRIEYSLSHHLADNFSSHDPNNDEIEVWRHADGRTQDVGKTKDGIYYNADQGKWGQAINMSELRKQGFTRQS